MTVIASRNNQTQLTFVVTNINSSKKSVTLYNNTIRYLGTLDLMKVKGLSENDIKDALIKGDLRVKIDNGDLRVLNSNINLVTFDTTFQAWLNANGIVYGTVIHQDLVVTSGSIGIYDCPITVNVGDVVYLSAPNTVDKADADDASKQPLIGIVESKPSLIQASVKYNGEISTFMGLVSGNTYYLSINPGQFTTIAPSAIGSIVQKIGFAKSPTTLVVLIDREYVQN